MQIIYDSVLQMQRQKDAVSAGDLTGVTTADIAESTNKKYITDAEETAIGTIASKAPIANATLTGTTGVDRIQLNTSATPVANAEGLMQWNATDGTVDLGMSGGAVAQQIGQELFIKVINKTASTIANGTPVYFIGRQGNRPKIALARSDTESTSRVMGVTTQDIIADAEGFITSFGYVRQIKTNYSGAGDWGTTWAEGDKLYVSKTIAGQLTNIEPTAPHHADIVGCVGIIGGAGVGSIDINIHRHATLQELSDINGTALTTDGQIPVWHNTTGLFDFDKNINNYVPRTQNDYLKEPTGFVEPESVIINYDPTTQTIALTGTLTAYWRGTLITGMTAGIATLGGHDNTAGHTYWLYSDDGVTYKWLTDAFPGFDKLLIAYVNYGTTNKYAIRECHGLMDWRTHKGEHLTVGTYKSAGGTLTANSYTLASTTATNRRPLVVETTIEDEDCPTVLPALTSAVYTNYSLLGSDTPAVGVYGVDYTEIVPVNAGGNIPFYNQYTGGAWKQTAMANNEYQAIFLYGIPVTASAGSQKYRYLWVQGQTVSTTLSTIQAIQPQDLNLGTLNLESTEFVALVKIIIRYVGGGTTNWSLISVTNLTGNKFSQVGSPAGAYLSSVAVDGVTILGNGTVANPLTLNYLNTTFTSSNSTGFAWTDNTLAVTHNLSKQYVAIDLYDNNDVKCDYTVTGTSTSVATISFPIGAIPITGTYKIRIR